MQKVTEFIDAGKHICMHTHYGKKNRSVCIQFVAGIDVLADQSQFKLFNVCIIKIVKN